MHRCPVTYKFIQRMERNPVKRVDVACALIRDANGNILIVKNADGESYYWSLPGGAVEEGETLEQAVIREVKEETGLHVEVAGLSSLREIFFAKRNHHALIVTFHVTVIGGEIRINDPDNDILEVKWVDLQAAKNLMPSLFDSLKLDSETNKTLAFYAFEGIQ